MMDLSSFMPSETAVIQLLHPTTGQRLPTFFEIYGKDSKKYRMVKHNEERKMLENAGKRNGPEEVDARSINMLANLIKSWHSVDDDGKQVPTILFDGKELEYSVNNARKVLTSLRWIKEQIDTKVHTRAAFLPVALTN